MACYAINNSWKYSIAYTDSFTKFCSDDDTKNIQICDFHKTIKKKRGTLINNFCVKLFMIQSRKDNPSVTSPAVYQSNKIIDEIDEL